MQDSELEAICASTDIRLITCIGSCVYKGFGRQEGRETTLRKVEALEEVCRKESNCKVSSSRRSQVVNVCCGNKL